ncbi:hypothetical protein Tco_0002717 [Tanacetum coccineum]
MVNTEVNKIAKSIVPVYVAKGLLLDRQKTQADVTAMIAEAIQNERENLWTEISLQVTNALANSIPAHYQLYIMMMDDEKLRNDDLSIWWSLKIKFEKHEPSAAPCRTTVVCTRDYEDHQDNDARPEEGAIQRDRRRLNMALIQWMDGFGTDDDEVPTEEVVFTNSKEASSSFSKLSKRPKIPTNDCVESRPILSQAWQLRNKEVYSVTTQVKQDHIKRQKELRDKPEEFYLESKIIKVIRTSYELDHEHKFITKIMVRSANGNIDLIKESDYKYLNKNDIEDFSIIWEGVHDFQLGMESYQQKVNLTAPTITFPGIEREKLFTITSEPVIGMIYENNKTEKRLMIHKEIHKFCDATLKRVLEKLKKYSKDAKYGYAVPSPSDPFVEYLQFYEEDIKECLKHQDQMRLWEMYVNGRLLGSRRDRPE